MPPKQKLIDAAGDDNEHKSGRPGTDGPETLLIEKYGVNPQLIADYIVTLRDVLPVNEIDKNFSNAIVALDPSARINDARPDHPVNFDKLKHSKRSQLLSDEGLVGATGELFENQFELQATEFELIRRSTQLQAPQKARRGLFESKEKHTARLQEAHATLEDGGVDQLGIGAYRDYVLNVMQIESLHIIGTLFIDLSAIAHTKNVDKLRAGFAHDASNWLKGSEPMPPSVRSGFITGAYSGIAKQLTEISKRDPIRTTGPLYSKMIERLARAHDNTVSILKEAGIESRQPSSEKTTEGLAKAAHLPEVSIDEVKEPVEVVEETPREVLPDPALLAEAEGEYKRLEGAITQFNQEWFDIGRKWREGGFGGLFEDVVRRQQLYDKEQTPRIIGVAGRITKLQARQGVSESEQLDKAVGYQSELEDRVRQFKETYGHLSEYKQSRFFITDVSGSVATLRRDWTKLSESVTKFWPGGGPAAAEKIQRTIFSEAVELATETHDEQTVEDIANDVEEQREPPVTTAEVEVLRKFVEQLDEIILPPGSDERDFIEQLRKLGIEHSDKINWEKMNDLMELRKEFGGEGKIYRSKLKSSGKLNGEARIYYALIVELYGKRFAVAETPMTDNATYIIDESKAPGTWLEMLALHKKDVRQLGGKQVIHSSAAPYGPRHREKIIDYIFEQSAE